MSDDDRAAMRDLADEVQRLRDLLEIEALDLTEDGRLAAYETMKGLRAELSTLRKELESVRAMRDSYQSENARLKRALARRAA